MIAAPGPGGGGDRAFYVPAGKTEPVKIKLTAQGSRILAKLARVRVRVIVLTTDQAGNSTTSTRTLTVKAAKKAKAKTRSKAKRKRSTRRS